MPCWRTPSTSSTPNAFEPTNDSSLKYSGVSSQYVGPWTPAFTSVPRARATREPTSNVSRLPIVSYTTSIAPGYAIGSPSAGCNTPPDHAAASSITCNAGSCAITVAPSLRASFACALNRATTNTSTSGYSARTIAVTHVPSAPAPYTITFPPGGGAWRVTACNDTANGSAKTASSSGTLSGTLNNIESCAGMS